MRKRRRLPGVYPTPREMDLTGRDVRMDRAAIVIPRGATRKERFPAELFRRWVADEFLVNIPVCEGRAPRGRKKIVIGTTAGLQRRMPALRPKLSVPAKKEGYAVSVTPGGILAVGRDDQGALYAVSTLMQLLELRRGVLYAAAGAVRDWPYLPIRYVHVYVPGPNGVPFFKRYVRDFLLRYKFNGIILEVGGGVRLRSHPELSTGWKRTVMELYALGDRVYTTGEGCPRGPKGRFSNSIHRGIAEGGYLEEDELRDIVAFARDHGQDVVPEVQSLCHVYYLACAHREVAELPQATFPDAYCPSNPASYKLFFDVLDEIIEIMRPKTVHIGHDEWRAAGLCVRCRKVHPGKLFADDVIRIYRHLDAKGIGVWMWADHFVSEHNEQRRSFRSKRGTWYDHPSTEGAWKKVVKACPKIVVSNWSWSMKRGDVTRQGKYDAELFDKGFRFFYGNFRGLQFEDWEERSKRYRALGAETSSWSAMEEFELGKMHIGDALSSVHYLWAETQPPKDRLIRKVMSLLPEVRTRLSGVHEPPIRLTAVRQRTIDLSRHFNVPLRTKDYDLRGLRRGVFRVDGLACRLGKGAVVVSRPRPGARRAPAGVEIPVNERFAKLVFLQSATGPGRRPVHAGDSTFFPHESSELLGAYDVVFDDGLILEAEVRYAENVGTWDAGFAGMYYHARNIVAGKLPDGSPIVIWGNEWTNPRPDVLIRRVRFRGTAAGVGRQSRARPILLGITGIEKVRLSDYRVKS